MFSKAITPQANQPILDLKHLSQSKYSWTEPCIEAITLFMSDDEFYIDCLNDNLIILNNNNNNYKIHYDNLIRKRNDYFVEMTDYDEQITALSIGYANINAQQIDELNHIVNLIKKIQEERNLAQSRYENLCIKVKDIDYLIKAYHYLLTVSNRSKEGTESNEAIDAFLKLKLSSSGQQTESLIRLYTLLNSCASMRKKVFSTTDQTKIKTLFLQYDSSKNNNNFIYSTDMVFFMSNIKNKDEEQEILLADYINNYLGNGEKLINELKNIIESHQFSIEKEGFVDLSASERISELLERLDKALFLLKNENDLLTSHIPSKKIT